MRIVESALPQCNNMSYNKVSNMLHSLGYTSAAGNTYWQGVRASDRILIVADMGQGYAHTFLNGIRVFATNGHGIRLIGTASYSCLFYSSATMRDCTMRVIANFLKGEAKMAHAYVSDSEVSRMATEIYDEAERQTKLLA